MSGSGGLLSEEIEQSQISSPASLILSLFPFKYLFPCHFKGPLISYSCYGTHSPCLPRENYQWPLFNAQAHMVDTHTQWGEACHYTYSHMPTHIQMIRKRETEEYHFGLPHKWDHQAWFSDSTMLYYFPRIPNKDKSVAATLGRRFACLFGYKSKLMEDQNSEVRKCVL